LTRAPKRPGAKKGKSLTPGDIAAIWRGINPTITLSENENHQIASVARQWDATIRCVWEQDRGALAAAHKTLSKWCATHRRDAAQMATRWAEEGVERRLLPLAFDGRLLALERALAAVQELVEPLRARQSEWAIISQMVWQEAERSLVTLGHPGGTAPKSYAVRFTSAVLVRLGHPGATPDAVASVVKKFFVARAKFRDSAAKAGVANQGAIPTATAR
jgi:hypothetical protein